MGFETRGEGIALAGGVVHNHILSGDGCMGPQSRYHSFGIGTGGAPVCPTQVFADLQCWGHN